MNAPYSFMIDAEQEGARMISEVVATNHELGTIYCDIIEVGSDFCDENEVGNDYSKNNRSQLALYRSKPPGRSQLALCRSGLLGRSQLAFHHSEHPECSLLMLYRNEPPGCYLHAFHRSEPTIILPSFVGAKRSSTPKLLSQLSFYLIIPEKMHQLDSFSMGPLNPLILWSLAQCFS